MFNFSRTDVAVVFDIFSPAFKHQKCKTNLLTCVLLWVEGHLIVIKYSGNDEYDLDDVRDGFSYRHQEKCERLIHASFLNFLMNN